MRRNCWPTKPGCARKSRPTCGARMRATTPARTIWPRCGRAVTKNSRRICRRCCANACCCRRMRRCRRIPPHRCKPPPMPWSARSTRTRTTRRRRSPRRSTPRFSMGAVRAMPASTRRSTNCGRVEPTASGRVRTRRTCKNSCRRNCWITARTGNRRTRRYPRCSTRSKPGARPTRQRRHGSPAVASRCCTASATTRAFASRGSSASAGCRPTTT